VTSLATAVRSGLRAASRVPPVTIDARLTVDYRPADIKIDRVRRLFGPMTIDRVPCEFQTSSSSPNENSCTTPSNSVSSPRRGSGTTADEVDGIDRTTRRKKLKGDGVDAAEQGGTTQRRLRRKSSMREPVLVTSFNARTTLDEKGCKPTGVAVLDDYDDGRCLVVVVDDINKKLKVFDAVDGSLRLEIKPEGQRRLVDPWDVAVLPISSTGAAARREPTVAGGESSAHQPAEIASLGGPPRFVVSDRGSRDVKIFSESGEFVSSFGRHLVSPWGVSTNIRTRQILVTDTAKKTVFVHDAVGNLLFAVQSKVGPRFELQVSI